MRLFLIVVSLFLSPILFALPKEYFIYFGKCKFPFDMEKSRMNSSLFFCQKGQLEDNGLYIPMRTFGSLFRIDARGSVHYGVRHAFLYDIYYEQIDSNNFNELKFHRDLTYDTAVYQYGSPAFDSFRWTIGQEKPVFGINHFPNLGYNALLDPRFIWGRPELGMHFTYDSQNSVQIDLGWLTSNSHINSRTATEHLFTGRVMYDFPFNGNTRAVFSILQKQGERRLGLGVVGRLRPQNFIHAEWVRIYPTNSPLVTDVAKETFQGYKGQISSTLQLIRASFEDTSDNRFRPIFLYDDVSLQYRLFAFGCVFNIIKNHGYIRGLIAYKQDTSSTHRNRWLMGMGIGYQL